MTLYDDLSKVKNIKRYTGEFGVEIETEGLHAYNVPALAFWTAHKDDSLRGPAPYEYVLKMPLNFDKEIPEALEEFKNKTSDIKFDQKSFTTSVHVHVNMLNEKYRTMGNFLTTYAIVENILKMYAGPTRESNLFCLPLCDAEENLNNILYILKQLRARKIQNVELDMGMAKYAALNLCSLTKFGSLEVRLLRGVTDISIIHDWIGMLHSILQFSRQDIDPKQLLKLWREKGTDLLTDVFGPYRKKLRFDNEDELISNNFWYAANIAMVIDDWKAVDNHVVEKLNFNNLDAVAQNLYQKKFDMLAEAEKKHLIQNYKILLGMGKPLKVNAPAPGEVWHLDPHAGVAQPGFNNPIDEF